uniref:Cytochrome c biogenesis protein CcsA n=1 Tax=Pandorina morum TaxID=33099 RepID=A0A6C0RUS0_PANMO|nr:heme attachment to plastid cytochrome c [Pandorina morum]
MPFIFMLTSNVFLVLLLIVRWEKSGHFPLSNLYESLMFLSWCCTFLFIIYKSQKQNIDKFSQMNLWAFFGKKPLTRPSLVEGLKPRYINWGKYALREAEGVAGGVLVAKPHTPPTKWGALAGEPALIKSKTPVQNGFISDTSDQSQRQGFTIGPSNNAPRLTSTLRVDVAGGGSLGALIENNEPAAGQQQQKVPSNAPHINALREAEGVVGGVCGVIEVNVPNRLTAEQELENLKKFNTIFEKIVGSLIASSALLLNAFATFSLPKEMQQAAPLVPALQSNWLMMHVTVMIISYATLIIGSLLSILYLIINKSTSFFNNVEFAERSVFQNENKQISLRPHKVWTLQRLNNTLKNGPLLFFKKKQEFIKNYLDALSYRFIGLGFPFLTIGILSGAVWANEAWGSYWSWDPKETWALLTWLIFAIYLHTRLTKGWQGTKPAAIASLGFLVVWFCYLGVNLIGEGLHSYGFLN